MAIGTGQHAARDKNGNAGTAALKKVFLNSLPKAGTNLLAKCLKLLGYREQGGIGSFLVTTTTLKGRISRLLWKNSRDTYLVGIDSPVNIPAQVVDNMLGKVQADGFVSAHVGYNDELLHKALEMDFAPLLIVRDPRAVLASFVPYVVALKSHPLHRALSSMNHEERYWAAFRGGEFGAANLLPLFDRCMALQSWFAHDDVIKLRFEDIVGAKGGGSDDAQIQTLERLCRGLSLPEEQALEVARELFGPGRSTFRKGQIDSWRQEVPDEVTRELERQLAPFFRTWGYS